MGSLVAHELARHTRSGPCLLLRSHSRLQSFLDGGSKISVVRPYKSGEISSSEATMEADLPGLERSKEKKITDLVISTKSYATLDALKPYVRHITPETTILILQNGMGMAEAIQEEFWPTGPIPRIFLAVSTHGAYKKAINQVHHVGIGKLVMAPLKAEKTTQNAEIGIIPSLILCKELNASCVATNELLLAQMEKLVVNACINPMSALLDCLNGDLLVGKKTIPMMRKVAREASRCFGAEYGGLLATIPGSTTFLAPENLLNSVIQVCTATQQNSSSMREDVRNMRPTEIHSINGYIVKLGRKHAIPTPTNEMLVSMVENKCAVEKALEDRAMG